MKRRIYTPEGDTGIVLPIHLGGTAASNATQAARNLDLLTDRDLNIPNGAVTLDERGFIPKERLPDTHIIGTRPQLESVNGFKHTFPGVLFSVRITNYDAFTHYNISGTRGTVTRHYDLVHLSPDGSIGEATITVNGEVYTFEVKSPRVVKPVIHYPVNGATNMPKGGFSINASNFTVPGYTDTHKSTDWQVSLNAEFTDLIINNQNDVHSKTNLLLPELYPDRLYYARVRYSGERSIQSEWSDVVSFRTTTGVLEGREIQKIVNRRNAYDAFSNSMSFNAQDGTLVVGAHMSDSANLENCGRVEMYKLIDGTFRYDSEFIGGVGDMNFQFTIPKGGYVAFETPQTGQAYNFMENGSVTIPYMGTDGIYVDGRGGSIDSAPGLSGELRINDTRVWNIPDRIERLKIVTESSEAKDPVTRARYWISYLSNINWKRTYSTNSEVATDSSSGKSSCLLHGSGAYGVVEFEASLTAKADEDRPNVTNYVEYPDLANLGMLRMNCTLTARNQHTTPDNYIHIPEIQIPGSNVVKGPYRLIPRNNNGSVEIEPDYLVLAYTAKGITTTKHKVSNNISYISYHDFIFTTRIAPTYSVSTISPSKPAGRATITIKDTNNGVTFYNKSYAHPNLINEEISLNKDHKYELKHTIHNHDCLAKITYFSAPVPRSTSHYALAGNGNLQIPSNAQWIDVIGRCADDGTPSRVTYNGQLIEFPSKRWGTLGFNASNTNGGTLHYELPPGVTINVQYDYIDTPATEVYTVYTSGQHVVNIPATAKLISFFASGAPFKRDPHGVASIGDSGYVKIGDQVIFIWKGQIENGGIPHTHKTMELEQNNQEKVLTCIIPEGSSFSIKYWNSTARAPDTVITSGSQRWIFEGSPDGKALSHGFWIFPTDGCMFGISHSRTIDGMLLIGAPGYRPSTHQNQTGVAYVMRVEDGRYVPHQTLTAPDGESSFGFDVVFDTIGNQGMISAPFSTKDGHPCRGMVYHVARNPDHSFRIGPLAPAPFLGSSPNLFYGYAVAANYDFTVFAISAPGFDGPEEHRKNMGAVSIHTWINDHHEARLLTPPPGNVRDEFFGTSLRISQDSTMLLVGATGGSGNNGAGVAYLYKRNGADWDFFQVLSAPHDTGLHVGFSVDISDDKSVIAIGGPKTTDRIIDPLGQTSTDYPWNKGTLQTGGGVQIWRILPNKQYEYVKTIRASDNCTGFGTNVKLSPAGDLLMVGSNDGNGKGAIYVYR